ncbi:hypothetical protein CICLE_v10027007mg, partial [Citrus x clementina]
MAWRCGTSARTVMSSARSYLPRIRPSPPPVHASRLRSRLSLPTTTSVGRSIGCTQSLMPLHGVVAATRLTSHISVHARAFCDLSQALQQRLVVKGKNVIARIRIAKTEARR